MSLLDHPAVAAALQATRDDNERHRVARPGPPAGRQPVHTVYGGAHLFRADLTRKLGEAALRAVETYARQPADLWRALDDDAPDGAFAAPVHQRVVEKLGREPVEDFRIDFEDGYGNRPDAEEDGHAESAAREVARGLESGTLPPFIGIRVKPFSDELVARSLRTLDRFVAALLAGSGGTLPPNFVVTLPKITSPAPVALLAAALAALEERHGLAAGALRLELMIETPQSIFDLEGRAALPALVAAAGGRCVAAHFGTYDYTASLDITAFQQTMDHPACDFARHVTQVALAGSGIPLSDGATNVLPVAPHRAAADGDDDGLTEAQRLENRTVVHAAWRLHYRHVRHSLRHAYYQGWDLHPAHLPTRYAAVYSFFLEGLDAAAARLSNFVAQAAKATLVGDVFDDAATGQGLLNYFLRALNCGAVSEAEVVARTGLTPAELRTRSFVRILEARRGTA